VNWLVDGKSRLVQQEAVNVPFLNGIIDWDLRRSPLEKMRSLFQAILAKAWLADGLLFTR
jgi:hypothetical protein